jgi:hypothetical protein
MNEPNQVGSIDRRTRMRNDKTLPMDLEKRTSAAEAVEQQAIYGTA